MSRALSHYHCFEKLWALLFGGRIWEKIWDKMLPPLQIAKNKGAANLGKLVGHWLGSTDLFIAKVAHCHDDSLRVLQTKIQITDQTVVVVECLTKIHTVKHYQVLVQPWQWDYSWKIRLHINFNYYIADFSYIRKCWSAYFAKIGIKIMLGETLLWLIPALILPRIEV